MTLRSATDADYYVVFDDDGRVRAQGRLEMCQLVVEGKLSTISRQRDLFEVFV